jgi:hypothetical protein
MASSVYSRGSLTECQNLAIFTLHAPVRPQSNKHRPQRQQQHYYSLFLSLVSASAFLPQHPWNRLLGVWVSFVFIVSPVHDTPIFWLRRLSVSFVSLLWFGRTLRALLLEPAKSWLCFHPLFLACFSFGCGAIRCSRELRAQQGFCTYGYLKDSFFCFLDGFTWVDCDFGFLGGLQSLALYCRCWLGNFWEVDWKGLY